MKKTVLMILILGLSFYSLCFSQDYSINIKDFSNQVLRSVLDYDFKGEIQHIGVVFEKNHTGKDKDLILIIEKTLIEKLAATGYKVITNESRAISLEELEFGLATHNSEDIFFSDLKEYEIVALLSIVIENDSISIYCKLIDVKTSEIFGISKVKFNEGISSDEIIDTLLPNKVYISAIFDSPFSFESFSINSLSSGASSWAVSTSLNYMFSNRFLLSSLFELSASSTQFQNNGATTFADWFLSLGIGAGYSIEFSSILSIPLICDLRLSLPEHRVNPTTTQNIGSLISLKINLQVIPTIKVSNSLSLLFYTNLSIFPIFMSNTDFVDIAAIPTLGGGFSFVF